MLIKLQANVLLNKQIDINIKLIELWRFASAEKKNIFMGKISGQSTLKQSRSILKWRHLIYQ